MNAHEMTDIGLWRSYKHLVRLIERGQTIGHERLVELRVELQARGRLDTDGNVNS